MTFAVSVDARPPFQVAANATGALSAEEIDALIAAYGPKVAEAKLGDGGRRAAMRRSQTVFLENNAEHRWLYDRIWRSAVGFNERFFGVDISGIQGKVQLARYDACDEGFYDWHTDFGELAPMRKISITIQLSDPADYDGGDLELLYRNEPFRCDKTRGLAVAFPSFVLHRVAPVTRGTRWSLVAWITGPRWR